MFEKLLQYITWSVTGFTPLSARFSSRLVDVNFVVDKFALWQVFLQELRFYPRIINSSVFYIPKFALHQYSIPWLYHFTSAPCPIIISLPASRALALSLHQRSIPWCYHFTNVPHPGIITLSVRHALALSLYQRPVPWRYHFTNVSHPGIITSQTFHTLVLSLRQRSTHWYYHFTNVPYPGIITSPKFHTLVLPLHQLAILWHCHFSNAACPDIITSPFIHAVAFWRHQSSVTNITTSPALYILVLSNYHIFSPTYLHHITASEVGPSEAAVPRDCHSFNYR